MLKKGSEKFNLVGRRVFKRIIIYVQILNTSFQINSGTINVTINVPLKRKFRKLDFVVPG